MFCPECLGEFREGFTACNDCNVPLVEHLTAEELHPGIDLSEPMILFTEEDLIDFAVAEQILDAVGIPHKYLSLPHYGRYADSPTNLMYVARRDSERAIKALRAHWPELKGHAARQEPTG